MKVPLSWLASFVDLPSDPVAISQTLTSMGIEVEKILGLQVSFTGVVVGKVLEVEKHPGSDRLQIARVTDGALVYQVVCGAPNCRPGLYTPFAKAGASLQDSKGERWVIQKNSIRGIESEGMLCSGEELQLGHETDGILELSSSLPLGADFGCFATEPIFHLSLTPNLGHCFSILGIARQLAAAYNGKVTMPSVNVEERGALRRGVIVRREDLCSRYACRMVSGVKVAPSPVWLQERLVRSGLRPIHNLVDVANYVMLEMGHPLHIFDLEKIKGNLVVDTSERTEQLETLDGQKREIPPGTLLIWDECQPLAIAGIMGGSFSAVTDTTSDIVIECAVFDSVSIRRSTKLLDLKSEASYRFERGIDRDDVVQILDRAAALIQEIAGGEAHPIVDEKKTVLAPRMIQCRLEQIGKVLNLSLTMEEAVALCERLDMRVGISGSLMEVWPPTYRNDIVEEIDLIEEIGKLYGYQNIPRKPVVYSSCALLESPIHTLHQRVRQLLLQQGLQECMTCSLISPTSMEASTVCNDQVHLLHPRSIDQSVLRPSLLMGLLQVVRHNVNHQVEDLSAFEVGRTYRHCQIDGAIVEPLCAGIILTGAKLPHHFTQKKEAVDFFDIKGIVESLCNELRIEPLSYERSHFSIFHPGRQALLRTEGNTVIGFLGELHPQEMRKLDVSERIYFAQIDLSVVDQLQKRAIQYADLPMFPASSRDWTVTLGVDISVGAILEAIKEAASPLLETVYLLDLFHDSIEGLKRNATFRLIYRECKGTISFEAAHQEHQKVIHSVAKKFDLSV